MLLVKTEVRPSPIAEEGLFALEPIKKGTIVAILSYQAKIMSEDEYQMHQRNGNELIVKTAVRWVGDYFLYLDAIGHEEYINHSSDPNLLYHCGICFALRDIQPGEEMTAKYQYFLARQDVHAFVDSATGEHVDGLPPREALLKSAKELVAFLQGMEEWAGK
jgi:SET domain-containing protein